MKKVSVIGAGFAGLTVSLRLAQKGFTVDLYEKSSRVGGLLGTDQTEYGIAERAANALMRTKKSEDLFTELGVEKSLPLKESRRRFIYRYTPKQWPLTFLETLFFIGKVVPRVLFAKKSMKPVAGETLESWGQRILGGTATEHILGPAMQGIYGNDISGLSSKLILSPLFTKKKKDGYKGLLTGPGGMQDLVNHLEIRLRELGVNIYLNNEVDVAQLTGPVVIATSAAGAAKLLETAEPTVSSILKKIRMSSLMSVTLFFKKPQVTYKGFGCLIPRGFDIKALGVLMNSYIFKDRDKTYNETWIMGGVKEAALLDLNDPELLKLIAEERFKILGNKEGLLDYRINRWREALPYYDLNLEKAQDELATLPKSRFVLHGNYLSGIGLSKILERSDLIADEIAGQHG